MPETKEWTLMFYMASDNPLATSIVSQLKALKDAGFHHEVNVIAQFDPFTEGTPTHIFDVNSLNKLKQPFSSNIGFAGSDSYVHNLIEDKLWRDEKRERTGEKGGAEEELVREALQRLLKSRHEIDCILPRAPELNGTSKRIPGQRRFEPDPYTALGTFLDFCSQKYPARHYMLFMLGHGVVVGNDVFMFDEHAERNSITLSEMGEALSEFNLKIKEQESTFELVAFHSCSVSSLEVAFELKGTANYMLASQAPAFVGSWPYRQILIRVFNDLKRNGRDVNELISDIFYYCLYNSADYLLAGYSHQVTLCDLNRVADLEKPMRRLSAALVNALDEKEPDAASHYVVLYAHWRAQSFFDEMYTDLYDFCHTIVDRCERIQDPDANNGVVGQLSGKLQDIKVACIDVLAKLTKPDGRIVKFNEKISPVVVAADFVGPAFQYSHGLSVYFPWTRPSEDSQIMEQYVTYKFHKDLKKGSANSNGQKTHSSWLDFLEAYFKKTQRFTKKDELAQQQDRFGRMRDKGSSDKELQDDIQKLVEQVGRKPIKEVPLTEEEKERLEFALLQEDIASLIYNGEGPLGGVALKNSPSDRTGGNCQCPSFKNNPRDTRAKGRRRKKAQRMPVSETLLGQF